MLLQNHYPRFRRAPSGHFRMLTRRPPSVDSGLGAAIRFTTSRRSILGPVLPACQPASHRAGINLEQRSKERSTRPRGKRTMPDYPDPIRTAQQDLQAAAREAQYLHKLPPSKLLRLIGASAGKRFESDSVLLNEGSLIEDVYIVLQGLVVVGLYQESSPALWLYVSGRGTIVDACAPGPARVARHRSGRDRRGRPRRAPVRVRGRHRGRWESGLRDPTQSLLHDVHHQSGDAEGGLSADPRAFSQLAATRGPLPWRLAESRRALARCTGPDRHHGRLP